VSKELDYDIVNSIDLDNFDPIANRDDSDKICEYLDRTINSPGVDLRVRIETGPRNESVHKDIDLGNICCNRTCNCDIIYKSSTLSGKANQFLVNIEEFLPKRPLSYYCDDELNECIEDCKIAAGHKLRNTEIQKPDASALDLEIFKNSLTARRACLIYNTDALRPNGVDVYLRYGTGFGFKEKYPYTQELLLGKLCCYEFQKIPLFPFNKCQDWYWLDFIDLDE
jgi:predicted metal-binding transcription factor (methanogenesis marker protein 9)